MNEMVNELTNGEFNDFIKSGTVLIDFYADWCMPCVMMGPVVEEMEERFEGKIRFGKVNVDDNHAIAQKFGVMSIPNFVLFKEGKVSAQFAGGMSEEDFENKLKKFV